MADSSADSGVSVDSSAVEHWLAEWSAGVRMVESGGVLVSDGMGRKARAVRGLVVAGVGVVAAGRLLGVSEGMVRKLLKDERGRG